MSFPSGLSALFEAMNDTEEQNKKEDELLEKVLAVDEETVDQDIKDEFIGDGDGVLDEVEDDIEDDSLTPEEKKKLENIIDKLPDMSEPTDKDVRDVEKAIESYLNF